MENALRLSYTVVNRLELLVERIQRELKERNMQTIDLVRQSGASQSSIYNLMSGKRGVEPETLKAIGYVLDIPTLELAYYIGLADEMPVPKQSGTDRVMALYDRAPDKVRKQILEILRILSQQ